jgi:hypothetical protein
MNATMVASGTKAIPAVVSSIQDIPQEKICKSKTNPRRFFDEAKLAELADFVPGNKIRSIKWDEHKAQNNSDLRNKEREALGKTSQAPPLLRQRKPYLTGSPPSRQERRCRQAC